ncbi:MAG: hypothetical protein ACP5LQ_08600 [Candidatus Methanodesulfokora sp.]
MRIRIFRGDKIVDIVALVNSGYEADSPQLMVPIQVARELGLWPPVDAREGIFDTAGGPLRVWIVERCAEVRAVADDAESKSILADIVISPLADEPLISDVLAGRLEIAVEDFAEGLWRFRWEPSERTRRSAGRATDK